VQGYFASAARAELTDAADTALRRMARDLRLALPNSVRVSANASGTYLELLLTKTGGRYLSDEDAPVIGQILDFDDASKTSFQVVGPMPSGPLGSQTITPGDRIVVYNLGPGFSPADAYNCNVACNRATVSAVDSATHKITLSSNPFAAQAPKFKSPEHHFQVVTDPVTYVCAGGSLTRYWGYPIQAAQPVNLASAPLSDAGTSHALLATGVIGCSFSSQSLANTHTGLIDLSLTMQDANNADSGSVTLVQQVHVDNTP
jgi:MSHA biogenesis protein MshO